MYHNLKQLQWQLERDNVHGHDSKTYLVVLKTRFKEFFDLKEVNASNVHNKIWQESFSDGAKWELKNFRRLLLCELQQQESLVTEGAALEACLVNEGITLNDNTGVTESSGTESEDSSSETPFSKSENENRSTDKKSSSLEGNVVDADIGPSYDSDTVTDVPNSNNDTSENAFAHEIQNHEQPKSIPDTYVVNENNSNIASNIPNMDLDRDKEEHDDVDYEQQRVFLLP
ncbi:hypothetical protein Tco_0065879 [Tanacetum coccineum]